MREGVINLKDLEQQPEQHIFISETISEKPVFMFEVKCVWGQMCLRENVPHSLFLITSRHVWLTGVSGPVQQTQFPNLAREST